MSDQIPNSTAPFPRTNGREKGYRPDEVDDFLSRARAAFEQGPDSDITSAIVRTTSFALTAQGYQIATVDAAMGRIEDAFAAREREYALGRAGARAWVSSSRKLAQEVLDRLSRPEGERFARVGALRFGYRVDEVDLITDKIARFLESGEPVTVDQVRGVAFRMQRGGYNEAQVDAVLDAVVSVMLAVV